MKVSKTHIFGALVLMLFFACQQNKNPEAVIKTETIDEHIRTLASDAFLGRQPGTEGEPITINYIAEQFKEMGIAPAVGDSYFQAFEIAEVAPVPPKEMTIKAGEKEITFKVKEDFIASTPKIGELVSIKDKEIVFVGFGIVAPEYDWDDYQGVDVKDKIVMVLYNDPGLYSQDSTMFQGLNPTKYSSSSYKKAEAFTRGAVGMLTIFHDTGATGLNWGLVQALSTRPKRYLKGEEPKQDKSLPFSGMISVEMAQDIIRASGHDFDHIEKALEKDFNPIPMGVKASVDVQSKKRVFKTHNVLGISKGKTKPDEAIIYTAHWDHDGYIKNSTQQDSVYNGAIDNATGVAMVLETARAFQKLKNRQERSIIFFLTSAEEMGLLGAKYYTQNPIVPLGQTVCAINADASYATERMRIAVNVLKGYSDAMDQLVDSAATLLGREIIPDPAPQIGAFYRSDHFPFVEKGVPAVWNVGGADPMAGDSIQQMKIIEDYANRYHQLNDDYYEGFNTQNITFDAQLNFLVGHLLANTTEWPNWNPGLGYKEIRDKSRE